MDIEWEEPPQSALLRSQGTGRYMDLALALRDHPGRWAVLPNLGGGERSDKGAAATARSIKQGRTKGFAKGEYETAVEGGKVWVRYQPPAEQPEAAGEAAGGAGGDTKVEATGKPATADVRAWAQKQGLHVPDRGRLPDEVWDKYAAAVNAGERGLPLRAVPHGGDAG